MQDNPAIQALHDLASMEPPRASQEDDLITPSGFRAFQAKHAPWVDLMKHKTATTFSLMEQHKIPHHPKLKAQHDRGMITGQEYAMQLLNHLYFS